MDSKAKLFNLSWVLTNDAEIIEVYRVVVMDDGSIVDNATILHPDTTSALISVSDEIKNPQFFLKTVDKCNKMSLSNTASISYVSSTTATATTATTMGCMTTGMLVSNWSVNKCRKPTGCHYFSVHVTNKSIVEPLVMNTPDARTLSL